MARDCNLKTSNLKCLRKNTYLNKYIHTFKKVRQGSHSDNSIKYVCTSQGASFCLLMCIQEQAVYLEKWKEIHQALLWRSLGYFMLTELQSFGSRFHKRDALILKEFS